MPSFKKRRIEKLSHGIHRFGGNHSKPTFEPKTVSIVAPINDLVGHHTYLNRVPPGCGKSLEDLQKEHETL